MGKHIPIFRLGLGFNIIVITHLKIQGNEIQFASNQKCKEQ